ncbi:sensor histidine kinase [Dysgonomonas sp. BGC7]|uniref:sensor histidine kinase n=1 Tax=Dysgonomonas sp. BGC7 TaxID=1658008 RepID=UPI000681DDFB|nr:histidine kinase [Dysgonomonas sp. BGC7]MBD8388416.1 histidine kinase [Dysgonomonas sp. BGC7]
MQITENNNNLIIKLLTHPYLKIFRHLILLIFIASISGGFIWYMQEEVEMTTFQRYGGLLFFIFIFLGSIYLNIYILVPKLLEKNKWAMYFSSLLSVVLLIILLIFLIQAIYIPKAPSTANETNIFSIIINVLSSTMSIFLLLVGTTTLVLFKHWISDMKQSEELESNTLSLELKLLENQINPHFLFNMLNNANIMIKKDPEAASNIIYKLEEMLRYQMNDNTRKKVLLKEEILFLDDYLELERTRRDYFDYIISTDGNIDQIELPPLLFITFVENAVKHNSANSTNSYVHIMFTLNKEQLIFICENSISQRPIPIDKQNNGGIGLINIRRRLDLLFENNYSLEQTKTKVSYTTRLILNL